MDLAKYNSFLKSDKGNAVFRAHHALDAFTSWKIPEKLLDVGCGSGELLQYAKERGVKEISGVDGVFESIEKCRKFVDHVHNIDLNTAGLPFEDNTFDGVTCLEVLEHLYDPQNTINEIMRVTQEGGRVLVSVPNPFSYSTRLRILLGGNISDPAIIGGHIKFFLPGEIKVMCEESGMHVVNIWGLANPSAYKKYGSITNIFLKWKPTLFATWLIAFCEKPPVHK